MPILTVINLIIKNWHWVVILSLSAAVYERNMRLELSEAKYETLSAEIDRAVAQARENGYKSGLEATEGLRKNEQQDEDAVNSVLDSIDELCQRSIHPEMPPGTPLDAGGTPDSQDSLRRARANQRESDRRAAASLQLVENLKSDIQMCNSKLNECRWRVRWMIDNGAADKE